MKRISSIIAVFSITLLSCQTKSFVVLGKIDNNMKEVSAVETLPNSSLVWVIEDGGNGTNISGLNTKGETQKKIKVSNVQNKDWEELTTDHLGNLYIGDFGNNSRKRTNFSIYKINNLAAAGKSVEASEIEFTLPKGMKSKDMEAFFLRDGYFYIFTKEGKKAYVIKVPNSIGKHTATMVADFNLKGKKNNEITAAAISSDGKTIVLLNHDRVWKLTDFNGEDFFGGKVEGLDFGHDSKKEGVCFKTNSLLYITDERRKGEGGNIYSFKL